MAFSALSFCFVIIVPLQGYDEPNVSLIQTPSLVRLLLTVHNTLIVVFNLDARAENEGEPDPRKPFSCIMSGVENFTDFSVKGYLAL